MSEIVPRKMKKWLLTQANRDLENTFFNKKVERHDLFKHTGHLCSYFKTQITHLSKESISCIFRRKIAKILIFDVILAFFVVLRGNRVNFG